MFTKGLTNYRVKLLKSKLIVHDRSHACGGVLAIIKITPRINELLIEKKKKKAMRIKELYNDPSNDQGTVDDRKDHANPNSPLRSELHSFT